MANNTHHHNYTQPFGYLYAYPPPPQQPEDPPVSSQHVPPPSAFPHIPGLNPPALPGINFSSFAQNGQQPPFPQAAWPPQMPVDPSAWLYPFQQNGIPPSLPGLGYPPPPSLPLPQNFPAPPPFPPPTPSTLPPQPSIVASERVKEVMDGEREDGELSENDTRAQSSAPKQTSTAHKNVPRSVPQNGRAAASVEQGYNPARPSAGQSVARDRPRSTAQKESSPSLADQLPPYREEAKQFVKLLHSHNIGYQVLAKEGLDLEQLRDMYKSLNLPSEPASVSAPKTNGSAISSPAVQSSAKAPAPVFKTNTGAASAPAVVPTPTAAVDRKDYIARLQAAKKAKQAGSATADSPQQPQSGKPSTPVVTATTPQAIMTPKAKQPVTDEQRARNTELIKQRLQALKRKQEPPVSGSTTQKETLVPQNEQPSTQTVITQPQDNQQVASSGLPGIPGLFMNHTSSAISDSQDGPKLASSTPQKWPVMSGFGAASTPSGSVTPYTRKLGQSPHANHEQDDGMIIDVSDDGSNGSDMDIDDDQPAQKSVVPMISAVNTSTPQTPSSQARGTELEDKERQLAEMKLLLKRKFAEKREKEKAAAANGTNSSPQILTPSVPVLPAPADHAQQLTIQTVSYAGEGPAAKRLRREEIQSRLPAFDVETASNTNKIAQLTKEIEQLAAQNARIAKDKALLIEELESLGVDTEGMSHADLRAKKDEIEREASPEKQGPVHENPGTLTKSTSQGKPVTTAMSSSTDPLVPHKIAAAAEEQADMAVGSQTQASGTTFNLPGLRSGVSAVASTPLALSNAHQIDEAQGHPTDPGTCTTGTPLDDEEDFYSPPPAGASHQTEEPPAEVQQGQVPRLVDAPRSPSEDGEVEMSESSGDEQDEQDEGEYEPEELAIVTATTAQDARPTAPEAGQPLAPSQISTEGEDEEAYEPPDVGSAALDEVVGSPETQAEDGAMDIESFSDSSESESESDSETDEEEVPEPEPHTMVSTTSGSHTQLEVTDGPAPQPLLEIIPVAQPASKVNEIVEDEPPKFTPYESPLRMFKSYRYHPSYAQDVAGGFLSLTFSHQIDPQKPLCPFEAAGGTCNDEDCPNQHFAQIAITGERLLVQLGTANPGKTPEEKTRWNDGLRGVLKELRAKNIKDPKGIAIEIAHYRRQFLNDDTRVVNL